MIFTVKRIGIRSVFTADVPVRTPRRLDILFFTFPFVLVFESWLSVDGCNIGHCDSLLGLDVEKHTLFDLLELLALLFGPTLHCNQTERKSNSLFCFRKNACSIFKQHVREKSHDFPSTVYTCPKYMNILTNTSKNIMQLMLR